MTKKAFISTISFVLINTCVIFYIAYRAKLTTGISPNFRPIIYSDTSSEVIIRIDSLNNTYLNGIRISITDIRIALDSVKSDTSKIDRLVLISHPDCNIDTLKKVAGLAAESGLRIHVRK